MAKHNGKPTGNTTVTSNTQTPTVPAKVKVRLKHYYASYPPGTVVEVSKRQADVWLQRNGCELCE